MSKHLGKIIDLLKGARQLDMLDSSQDIEYPDDESIEPIDQNTKDWEGVESATDLKEFLLTHKNLKESQYIDLIGGHKIEDYWHSYAKDMANNWAKEHNNPATNDKALQKIADVIAERESDTGNDYSERDISELKSGRDVLIKHFNLSSKAINDAVNDGNLDVLKNDGFGTNHLYKMLEKFQENTGRADVQKKF